MFSNLLDLISLERVYKRENAAYLLARTMIAEIDRNRVRDLGGGSTRRDASTPRVCSLGNDELVVTELRLEF